MSIKTLCQTFSSLTFSHLTRHVARGSLGITNTNLTWKHIPHTGTRASDRNLSISAHNMASMNQLHKAGPPKIKMRSKGALDGNSFLRGVVLKVIVRKPKKPNSANRKCVRLRLSNGKEMTAYIPGEGHNLQEHSIVLAKGGRLQDVPGVRLVCVRGKYDLAHVKKDK